jgi:hypothetical protein
MWSSLFSLHEYEYQYEYTKDERTYIKRLIGVYGNKYDYSKIRINSKYDKVTIVCFQHGDFSSSPDCMLLGKGCPKCVKAKRMTLLLAYYNLSPVKRKI